MRLQRKNAEAPQKRRRLLVNVMNACERVSVLARAMAVYVCAGGGELR